MQPMETDMRIPLGAALICAATLSAVATIPAGAEEMGSTTHVYKKAKPKKLHLPKLNLDALDSMTPRRVAVWKLCTGQGGKYTLNSGDGTCKLPD
jgi:hypothetical protein